MRRLLYFREPTLKFGYNQAVEDPHDGLTLFGPLDRGRLFGIRTGVVGSAMGLQRFRNWLKSIQSPIYPPNIMDTIYRPIFPGFEAVFGIPWSPEPVVELTINSTELAETLREKDRHQRVYRTVALFEKAILDARREEENAVDIWFVMVPPELERACRPKSYVASEIAVHDPALMTFKQAQGFLGAPALFNEINEDTVPFTYEPDFHNQLKARLLLKTPPIQVLQETTVAPHEFLKANGKPLRRVDAPSTIAWNLCSTAYYKASGRPWKLGKVRSGVCYLGLVFKRDDRTGDPKNACCAAQMFLDSGDGVVFKGAVGPWYTGKRGEFHLSKEAAKTVAELAIKSYRDRQPNRTAPRELFVHGKTRINDDEWAGFTEAAGATTKINAIRIREAFDLKLYSRLDYPIPRGTAYIQSFNQAYLWTIGFVPRLQTYLGKEVPNPLFIERTRGDASIVRVIQDVLALTKLNYNACIFGDGQPVTLKFADAVGEILTAGPLGVEPPPLPFKHYI